MSQPLSAGILFGMFYLFYYVNISHELNEKLWRLFLKYAILYRKQLLGLLTSKTKKIFNCNILKSKIDYTSMLRTTLYIWFV